MEQVKMALLTQNFEGMVKGPESSPNRMMRDIPQTEDENIFLGLGEDDKLSACRVEEDIAVVQSAGLFTPAVYDAEVFGAVCAAHALNDIYAVNADPKVGLNLVGFPNCQNPAILGDILAGGANKVKEAGAVLVGGHTIQDDELKYGLCVTGFADPKKMWSKDGAEPEDVLVLTKAAGSGFIACAAMADMVSEEAMETAGASMAVLNKYAMDVMREQNVEVHACTEVKGGGLVGAVLELLENNDFCACIDPEKIPILPEAERYAEMGLVPELFYKNKKRAEAVTDPDDYTGNADVLYCPEISGGLLFAIKASDFTRFRENFEAKKLPVTMRAVGVVGTRSNKKIYLKRLE